EFSLTLALHISRKIGASDATCRSRDQRSDERSTVEKKTISKPESRSLSEFKRVPLYGVEDDRRWNMMSPRYPNSLKDDRFSPQSTAHFFGGCNGHGGSQLTVAEKEKARNNKYISETLARQVKNHWRQRKKQSRVHQGILLFRHELKSKRIKKSKSTTYHRLKNKDLKDGSSSDESDDEEEFRDGSDEDTPRLIAKAKEKTLKALEDDELPNAVLMSLPFMKNEEANEEDKRALEERVFGATAKVEAPKESRKDSDNFYDDSDSDNDMAGIEDNNIEPVRDNASPATNTITETEKFDDDVAGNPAYKTTFDVAMFASGSWKKMTGSKNTESKKASKKTCASIPQAQDKKVFLSANEESEDSESEAEQMVDRVLASASKETFVVPSQAELINRAFSGDDVLDEFEKDKDEFLNQEVPIYTYISMPSVLPMFVLARNKVLT
ncbi:hypothetical protein HID58_033243, partial [Brassica napus]